MDAFEDEKIQNAIDKLGYEGYAYYFILLEILAKKCEDGYNGPIRIHQQTLRSVWRKQSKSCIKVVTKLQESGLFVATFSESFIEFDVPKLSKYLGKYTNKNTPNFISKVNKIKVKEKKEKEKDFSLEDSIIDYFNKINLTLNEKAQGIKYTPTNRKAITARLKEKYTFENCKRAIDSASRNKWCVDNGHFNLITIFRPSKFEAYLNKPIQETLEDIEKQLMNL